MFQSAIKRAFDADGGRGFVLPLIPNIAKWTKAAYRGATLRRLSSRNRRLILSSGLFDAKWYLDHAPEAAASPLDPLDHYFTVGWKQGRSPGPNFDAAWYLAFYNDVAVAGCEPLLHFIRYGKSRGRARHGALGSIYDAFESLGDDCEFRGVQSRFGSNQIGLFRAAGTNIDGLIAAFNQGLDRLITDESVEIIREKGEYRTRVGIYGMLFHTNVAPAIVALDDIKAHEIRRLKILARKLIEDLCEGRKILVYKARQIPLSKMVKLAASLQRFGPNRLLCVTWTQAPQKLGHLDVLSDTLAVGYIDRFDVDPEKCSIELWAKLCAKAYAHWCRNGRASSVN